MFTLVWMVRHRRCVGLPLHTLLDSAQPCTAGFAWVIRKKWVCAQWGEFRVKPPPPPPVTCTADSFIYLWGFFFGCWLVCRIPGLFQALVQRWLSLHIQACCRPWGRAPRVPPAEGGGGGDAGGGGVKTAGRLLTTVNAMVTPGGNLLWPVQLWATITINHTWYFFLSLPPSPLFVLLKRCTCCHGFFFFPYQIAWWYISFFIL